MVLVLEKERKGWHGFNQVGDNIWMQPLNVTIIILEWGAGKVTELHSRNNVSMGL